MLQQLLFVDRAVSDKGIVPQLTHICIDKGRLQATDHRITADIGCDGLSSLSLTTSADKLIRAVSLLGDEMQMEITPNKKLCLRAGKQKVFLPAGKIEDFPRSTPNDVDIKPLAGSLLPALRVLEKFISTDASRPWSTGLWLEDNAGMATNNAILVRRDCFWPVGPVNLPRRTVEVLLEIGQEPDSVGMSDNAVTFYYGDAWLRSQLIATTWPEGASSRIRLSDNMVGINPELLQATRALLPFVPDDKFPVVRFKPTGIFTDDGIHSSEIDIETGANGRYHAMNLLLVLEVARLWDPTAYPAPIPFTGEDNLIGVFVGVRE